MYYVNENIANLYRTTDSFSRKGYLRLDMNENPEGLPKEFIDKVLGEITPEVLATYPETKNLTELLASYFNIDSNQVCLSNGSDEVIRLIFETFTKEGGKVVTASPTFAMYEVYCNMLGRKHEAIKYDEDFNISLEDILTAIDEHTNLVFALNPNNPIGTVFSGDEMLKIIKRAKECSAIVVIDEAYHYFYPKTFLNYIDKYDNVIVLRTFSKLFALATCRLGFAISNETIIGLLRKACSSFNVNGIALKFGEAIFKDTSLIDKLIAIQLEGKQYFVERMIKEGYEVRALEGNFVFIKPRKSVKELNKVLIERKILVKTYATGLLENYIRVTTGSKEIMKSFIDILLEVDVS